MHSHGAHNPHMDQYRLDKLHSVTETLRNGYALVLKQCVPFTVQTVKFIDRMDDPLDVMCVWQVLVVEQMQGLDLQEMVVILVLLVIQEVLQVYQQQLLQIFLQEVMP